MRLRLFKRNSVMIDALLFSVLSPFYLHVIYSLSRGVSALNKEAFIQLLGQHDATFTLTGIVIVGLFRAWRYAGHLFLLHTFIIFAKAFWPFLLSFDKSLLFFDFFYLIIGFYFFILWRMELNEAVYLPGFNKRDLGRKSEYDLPIRVYSVKTGEEVEGLLTNWDEKSLFFVPNLPNIKLRGRVYLKMDFLGRAFQSQGTIITGYGGGFGIRLTEKKGSKKENSSSPMLGWKEYYDIIRNRGYKPRFI